MLELELLLICHLGVNHIITISLEIKFIAPTKLNDKIIGNVSIDKITNSLVFLKCTLKSNKQIIATSSVFKILNHKIKGAGYGG